MSKLAFFLALSKNNNPVVPLQQLQDNINTTEIIEEGVDRDILIVNIPSDIGENIYRLFFARIGNVLANTYDSTSEDSSWDIWCVHTLYINDYTIDESRGTDVFRQLRRLRRSSSNRVGDTRTLLGPWSPKAFERKVGWLSDTMAYPQVPDQLDEDTFPLTWKRDMSASMYVPHVIAGDSPEYLATIDYDPTDEEIDNDTPADLMTIFGY
jgi:hypothetical protein